VRPLHLQALQTRLQSARRILIHPCPGADAEVLGSAVALRDALREMGPGVVLATPASPPEPLGELLDLDPAEQDEAGDFDLALRLEADGVLVVCPGSEDLHLSCGAGQDSRPTGPLTLGEMVFDLLEGLGSRLDGSVARALYVAIAWATDSFQNDRLTPSTHLRVGRLMESGLPADLLARRLFREDSLEFLRLLGKVLAGLMVALEGRVVFGEVFWPELGCLASEEDLPRRLAHRIDLVRRSELVVLSCERRDRTFQVLLRSRHLPAHQLAEFFGGTGGARQAGFVSTGPPARVRERLLEALAHLGA
jgi:nanoRNase/pAp phosphatase (c-di-AMP/oligoRNAs hydrolase)